MEEITLMDMGEDSEKENKAIAIVAIMKDAVIRDHISEPNQRLLYEYDFLHMKTFFIELLSVFKQRGDTKYPRCTFKRSEVVDDFTNDNLLLDDDEEIRQQLYEDFEDLLDDTIEGYDESDF
jgi:hypothetical protein